MRLISVFLALVLVGCGQRPAPEARSDGSIFEAMAQAGTKSVWHVPGDLSGRCVFEKVTFEGVTYQITKITASSVEFYPYFKIERVDGKPVSLPDEVSLYHNGATEYPCFSGPYPWLPRKELSARDVAAMPVLKRGDKYTVVDVLGQLGVVSNGKCTLYPRG